MRRGIFRFPGNGPSHGVRRLPRRQPIQAADIPLGMRHGSNGRTCGARRWNLRSGRGQGLRQKVARTQEGRIYPLLGAHRDESIQRVVSELQGEESRLLEQADGTAVALTAPRFLLPTATEESRAVLNLYERHLLAVSAAGAERGRPGRCGTWINARITFCWRRLMRHWRSCWPRGVRRTGSWCRRFGRCLRRGGGRGRNGAWWDERF